MEKAETQQQERDVIEECLSKHRNLDKYQGDDRGPREENNVYTVENMKNLNIIMRNAGVNHLIQNNSIDSSLEDTANTEDGEGEIK
jgi:hypothetical protein